MRIADLRNQIQNQYLGNNSIISGAEAKDLVKTVVEDGLTARGKGQLEKLRDEYKDSFSEAGLREFDKAFSKAVVNSDFAPPPSDVPSGTAVEIQGRDMSTIPTSFRLSEVQNPDVKKALRRLDFNNTGIVNHSDRDKMGFSDVQWRSFLYAALLLGNEIADDVGTVPQDLSGKKVCFTAVPDKAKATEWAQAMGATVVTSLSEDLDFLIVGNASGTGKDERAHAMNTLGIADIDVVAYNNFSVTADAAGVTGPAPTGLTDTEYKAKVHGDLKGWYTDMVMNAYEDDLAAAATPAEKAEVEAKRTADLENFDWADWGGGYDDGWFATDINERYEWSDPAEPFLDKFGVPVPKDALDVVWFSFYPDFAGIGLSVEMVYDKRTGELLAEGDLQD